MTDVEEQPWKRRPRFHNGRELQVTMRIPVVCMVGRSAWDNKGLFPVAVA